MTAVSEALKPLILKLDLHGQPVEWLHWQEAVGHYCRDTVRWSLGERSIVLTGGWSQATGQRSVLRLAPIIAVEDHSHKRGRSLVPRLCRRSLYHRDRGLCLYCARQVHYEEMQVEHVVPLSRGGVTAWNNVVCACHRCNHRKADRTPEQASMKLLAIPYVPNVAEYLILSNRRILSDQMEFLRPMVPRRRGDWMT